VLPRVHTVPAATRALVAAFLFAGVLWAPVAVAAPPALPAGWTAYYREKELYVPHPAGWQVQPRGSGAFTVHLPGSDGAAQALVYVKPQRFGPDRNAADALGLLQRDEPALFPQLRIVNAGALDGPHAGVRGELRFVVQGQPYRGVAVVLQQDDSGTLYVACARESAWSAQREPMARMLRSFRYLPARMDAPRAGAIDLQWVQWRDPAEAAFTVPVPRGWSVQGGLKRPNVLAWQPEVVVTSPDGAASVRMGEGSLELFAVPYAVPMVGQLPPGTKPSFVGGEFLDYLPGARFLAEYYVPRRFGQVAGLQGADLPDLARRAFGQQPPPAPMQGRADAGIVRFELGPPGDRRIAQYVATTHLILPPPGISGGSGNWYVGLLHGYVCRPEREALAQAVLAGMANGFRWDINWYARQVQIDIGNAKVTVAGIEELNRISADTNRLHAAGMDAAQRPLVQAAAGVIDVRDAGGTTYTVPVSGHQNYYLVQRTGRIIATDLDLPPYEFRELAPVR
jgi:hypothetical protein